jgi:pyridoxamine 5'-phosphate oxidase
MSSGNSLANPPWKKKVQDIIQKNLDDGHTDSLFFSLATLKPGPNPRPAVRTVGFRGFIGEPKDDKPDKLPGGNPPAQSSLILMSTDTLMSKVEEIEQTGGVYEVCWWHSGTNQQIRFSGTAHLLRRNAKIEFPETQLKQYILVKGSGEWSWEAERERMWKAHKPGLRGSFRNPPPGSPLDSAWKREKLKVVELDGDDDGPDAREAKERFSLVVLEITELEILDLDPPPVATHVNSQILTRVCRGSDIAGDYQTTQTMDLKGLGI